MRKIYMYAHGGSGNHGCEAIVRSTVKLLNEIGYKDIALISANPEEDLKYGVGNLCEIKKAQTPYSRISLDFVKAYLKLKIKKDYIAMDKLPYKRTIAEIKAGDIALSIGGDNYCYADVKKYVMLHDMMLERGAKTVLWGCSVEPNVIKNPEIAEDLKRYSLIVSRESISYEALKEVNPNTILMADPAFFLDSQEKNKEGATVGINVSPMTIKNEKMPGLVMACYKKLIQHILDDTKMDVLLIPHVVWKDNDDRIPLEELGREYASTGRVKILQDESCEKIKGNIKNCEYFVGARTHATIAAYSTGVPTIVLGYSVKARGIGKDIFGKKNNFILSVQSLETENDLLNEFNKLMEEQEYVVDKLKNYMKFVYDGLDRLKNAFRNLEE